VVRFIVYVDRLHLGDVFIVEAGKDVQRHSSCAKNAGLYKPRTGTPVESDTCVPVSSGICSGIAPSPRLGMVL